MRLGRMLREQRQESGQTLMELADQAGNLPVALLEDAEAGRASLDEATLQQISALYDLPVSELAPQRAELIIDLDEGVLSINDKSMQTFGTSTDQVLTRYLALVYSLRDLPAGAEVPLRNLDVGVLAHALEAERIAVANRLGELMTHDGDQVDDLRGSLRRKLVVPVAGILVGVTAIGGLVLVKAQPVATVNDDIPVEIGDAVMIAEPGADQTER